MRVLQLCKKFPFPLKDGESIAVNSLSRALSKLDCEISLLAMNTRKHFSEIPSNCPELSHYKSIDSVYVDNRINPIDAFMDLISGKSYHLSRIDSKPFRSKLIEILQKNTFDIIQLETSFMSMYIDTIREYSNAKIVIRSHNLEYEIWNRIAANTSTGPKSWYLSNCSDRLKAFELKTMNKCDMLISITDKDLQKYQELGLKRLSLSSPAGLDINNYPIKKLQKKQSIGFIGSLDWMPNLNGLKWFVDEVWPELSGKNPDLQFHIAGRNSDASLKSMDKQNVHLEGEVDNAVQFMNQHNILIVPLFSGSGIRVKILEGLALGKTVISTTIGAEGISAENGEHLLLADNKQQFLSAIQYCIEHPQIMDEFRTKGRFLIEEKYDYLKNAHRIKNAYSKLIGKPQMPGRLVSG